MNRQSCVPSAPGAGRRRPRVAIAGAALLLSAGLASGTPPTRNDLGFRYRVVATGAVTTVELRLAPRRSFETATVEAASGVASLTPCTLSGLVAGGAYACRLEVTGRPSAPAMTVNVVAQRAAAAGAAAETEVHHLTLRNPAYVPASRPKPVTEHVLTSSAPPPR